MTATRTRTCLTGGIACGKSLLSRFLGELGVETLDADDIVHELIPDPSERRRLAAEVFGDPAKRRELEAKLHPLVKARIDEWLGGVPSPSAGACAPLALVQGAGTKHQAPSTSAAPPRSPLRIAVIPLLFEARWEGNFDIICCVASERSRQIERMTATRGYTREEAEARLAAQMPVEEKAAKSHYVIRNDGSPEQLKQAAAKFVAWLKERQR